MIINSSLTVCEGVSISVEAVNNYVSFPHCMWGCIEYGFLTRSRNQVPSLYVRVYRGKCWQYTETASSLTVCEGVSFFNCLSDCQIWFPHYMWGCIGLKQLEFTGGIVPSLYVRVYHDTAGENRAAQRSLTVCEGVSFICIPFLNNAGFPHCMWGCIERKEICRNRVKVPSLYVRVYRGFCNHADRTSGSLTVCEGVSPKPNPYNNPIAFPHCMWGCIAPGRSFRICTSVPSLYVRVYL